MDLDALHQDAVAALIRDMSDRELHDAAEVIRQVQIERAIGSGDHDAIIESAFDTGFGRDGLGVQPWVEGSVIVCPGGLVSKSKASHRCRFVSVDSSCAAPCHVTTPPSPARSGGLTARLPASAAHSSARASSGAFHASAPPASTWL